MNIFTRLRNPIGRRQTSCWLLYKCGRKIEPLDQATFLANKIKWKERKSSLMPNNMADRSIYFFFFTKPFIESWLVVSKGRWGYTLNDVMFHNRDWTRATLVRGEYSHHCDALPPNELMGNKIVYSWRNMKKLFHLHIWKIIAKLL